MSKCNGSTTDGYVRVNGHAQPEDIDTKLTIENDEVFRGSLGDRFLGSVRNNLMLVLTLFGIVMGFILGFSLRLIEPSPDALMWIGLPGELFMRMLQMMILPLIICSVISGAGALDPKSNGKLMGIAVLAIFLTHLVACIEGIVFSVIIRPGATKLQDSSEIEERPVLQTQDVFADMIRNIVPDNVVDATFRQVRTSYAEHTHLLTGNDSESNITVTLTTRSIDKVEGTNLLGLIMVCVIVGIATRVAKDQGKPLYEFFSSATCVVLVILRAFLWYTPIGVCSLITQSLASIEDIDDTLTKLAMFVVTVVVGLISHAFIVLPLMLFITTRRNPFAYLLSMSRPLLIGFATTSAAVAIPEMITAIESNKIDKRVSRFVTPFCVTLNASGSTVYITSAAIFVSTVTGSQTGVAEIILIGVLVCIASHALPSVPSASIVALMIILSSMNVPANNIGFLFAVEWLLDRLRTPVNIVGHTFITAVAYHYCKDNLPPEDEEVTSDDDNDNEDKL